MSVTKCFKAARNWGFEYLLYALPGNYTIKILEVKEGAKGGLQSHHKKHECGLVLEGKLLIRTGPDLESLETTNITAGDFFVFPTGLVHQEEAVERTIILEISSPHFNDRIRYDHKDNIENNLATTNAEDVIYISSYEDLSFLKGLGFEECEVGEVPYIRLPKLFSYCN